MQEEKPIAFSSVQVNNANKTEFELILSGSEWILNLTFTKCRENTSFVIRNVKITNGNETFMADSSPKFMTALTKKFVCSSMIEIPMGNNTILYMINTTLQAFNMDPTDKLELCPRDMKIDFPITKITGAAVGLIVGGLITTVTGMAVRKRIFQKKETSS
ncbi:unnamed protein product [Hymenolepis diminuta]|uniref:Lysosome-associated membrane glycoprotein 1 n=1 Tax=Hymenolepis diminuta TaxID=6216 RepID=A0A0R3SHG6_HYMDI|nr:unnamed protein product [Hymenolepis diminuta]